MVRVLVGCFVVAMATGCSSGADDGQRADDAFTNGSGGERTAKQPCAGTEEKADIGVFLDAQGAWRFHVKAGNGEILLSGTKGFPSNVEAENALFTVQQRGHDKNVYRVEETADEVHAQGRDRRRAARC